MTAPITLHSRWEEFTTPERWQAWLDLARLEDADGADWWSTEEVCADCQHYTAPFHWCALVEMPASRNPVLDLLGMACCGAGYEPVEPQLSLILESS